MDKTALGQKTGVGSSWMQQEASKHMLGELSTNSALELSKVHG